MKQIAFILLGLWLIADATLGLGKWQVAYAKPVLAVIALCSGCLLLVSVIRARFSEIGLLLLSIWLIINSVINLFHVTFQYAELSMAVLAIVSGLFLLMRK